tara:strand:+ start:804 stop:1088 length:285 start_codon:yes stop_codon:yes gene_type:complete
MIEIFAYVLLPISIVCNLILFWYIKKVLSIIDDMTNEMRQRFEVFSKFMEETFKMDLFYGEERLKQLLDIIKDFHEWSIEFESRIVKEEKEDDG